MSYYGSPFNIQMIHESGGVRCPQVDTVRNHGLGRFTPAEPVFYDDPIALCCQSSDLFLPVPAIIETSMMQDYGASITATGRSDIHVGEPDVLIVDSEVQVTDGIGIVDFF